MNKPKPYLKSPASATINKRTLSLHPALSQPDFTPEQLREIAFRCERALVSPVQPATLEFDEWE